MKVLMVDSLVGNDYALRLCEGLTQAGVRVSLVTTEERDTSLVDAFEILRWMPSKDPSQSKLSKINIYHSYLRRLVKTALLNEYDLFHFQFFRMERFESLFLGVLDLMRTNICFTSHNLLPHERQVGDVFFRKLVFRFADRIIVHSNTLKNSLVEKYGGFEEKIVVVPHGSFDPLPSEIVEKAAQSRKILGFGSKHDVILFFGNIREYKGLNLLLGAFDRAAESNPRLRLVVAGKCCSSQADRELRSQIHKLKNNDKILLHSGFISKEHVPKYFQVCDLVILPYKHIGHSGVLNLAQSFSKPVLATDVGDLRECIEQAGCGRIIAKEDSEALARAILDLCVDKKLLRKMGIAGKRYSDAHLNWKKIAEQTLQIYRQVLLKTNEESKML